MKTLKICAISDTHKQYRNLIIPKTDILISCGDYSNQGEPDTVKDFHSWLNEQDATHKISVQGNHEVWVESNWNEAKQIALDACPGVHFTEEGPLEIEGIKFWCASVTPFFYDWAWNRRKGEIQKHWNLIPDDTEVLITHGPPANILDVTPRGENVGCPFLMDKIAQLPNLEIHIFGHIHFCGGLERHIDGVSYYNAAVCDERYMTTNPITIIDYIKN